VIKCIFTLNIFNQENNSIGLLYFIFVFVSHTIYDCMINIFLSAFDVLYLNFNCIEAWNANFEIK